MRTFTFVLGSWVLLACNTSTAPAAEPATEPSPLTPTPAPTPAPTPKPAPSSGEMPPASAGGLGWTGDKPLIRRAPKSSMRAAEYGVEGDETSELTVFFFGAGQGGDIDENIARWYGQLSQADGSDTGQHAKRRELKVNGIDVTRVEVSGRYAGGMAMPGAPPPVPIEDAALLGAIARGPQGSVFFKLIGTRAGVERARAAFDALITSLHPL